jgi:hypothetical protein
MTLLIQKPAGAKLNLRQTFTWNETVWNPSMISTALWLDAADSGTITESGGEVSQWNDKSGNGFHLSQASAGSRPTYSATGFNGRPTLSTDGGDILARASVPILKDVGQATIAIALEYAADASFPSTAAEVHVSNNLVNSIRMGLFPNVGAIANRQSLGGRRLDNNSFVSVNSSADSLALRGSPFLKVAQADYQNAQANHWTNGTQDLTAATFQNAGNTSNTNSANLAIFGTSTTNNLMPAGTKISEVVVTENTLSTLNRQRIEGYLAHKWGLTANLPNDHPYKNVGPTP